MPVVTKLTQKVVTLQVPLLTARLTAMLKVIELPDWTVNVWYASDSTVREYNKNYRGISKSTDILSFPFHKITTPGVLPVVDQPELKVLGDMLLSVPYIQRHCAKLDCDLHDHMTMIFAHGLTHLLGYEHETDAQFEEMSAVETKILTSYQKFMTQPEQPAA